MTLGDVYYQDFQRDDAEKVRWLKKRPVCAWCGEHIQDESALYFDDSNDWMCDKCQEDKRRFIYED